MGFRSRLRFLPDAGIFLFALGLRGGWALAATLPDAGYYPVSSRPPPAQVAPLLLFEKIFETEVPGLPSGRPLEMRADGRSLIVRTNAGDFEIDLRTASTYASAPPAPRRAASGATLPPSVASLSASSANHSTSAAVPSASPPASATAPPEASTASSVTAPSASGGAPTAPASSEAPSAPDRPEEASSTCSPIAGVSRWLHRVQSALGPVSGCVEGPDEAIALLSRDGTIYARARRRGQLLWRHIASHRISDGGARYGPYLLVVPDASRTLESLRWSDGSSAGVFRLDSEDAYFASPPLMGDGLLYVLAVDPPIPRSRLIALRLHTPSDVRPPAPIPGPPAAR